MPFDINDPDVQNVLTELEEIEPDDVEEITRERRNYMVFVEGRTSNKYLGVSLRERAFDREEFNKVVDTQIRELS